MSRYEELKTPESVLAAFAAGRHVEFTMFEDDRLDAPHCDEEDSNGWIRPVAFARMDPQEFMTESFGRYRALIEEPAIPAGYTPWGGGECPEDARGKFPELIFRDGSHWKSKFVAEKWRWSHGDDDHDDDFTDIIAYKVDGNDGAWTDEDEIKPWGCEIAFLRHLAADPALNPEQAATLRHCARRIESTANVQQTDIIAYRVESEQAQKDGDRVAAALRTVEAAGYTYHGGEQWKPPLGKAPTYITGEAQPSQQGGVVYQLTSADPDTGGWFDVSESAYLAKTEEGRKGRILYLPIPVESLGRDAEGVEGLASEIGRYCEGDSSTGAPAGWWFGEQELAEFARRLRPQVDEAMKERAARAIAKCKEGEEEFYYAYLKAAELALTAALTEADSHG
jgi:hypothetical protein